MEICWCSAVSSAIHCFSFFFTARAMAWNWWRAFWFSYLANREPDLADAGHWAVISSVVGLRLFKQLGVSQLQTHSAVTHLHIVFKMGWLSNCSDSEFSSRSLYSFRALNQLSPSVQSFAMMPSSCSGVVTDSFSSLLARLADRVLSVSIISTTTSGKDGQMVCSSLFLCFLVSDRILDVSRARLSPRQPRPRQGSFSFL